MTVVVAVLGVLLAVALLFIVALLRSHAEILRRLAAVESALDEGQPARGAAAPRNGAGERAWRHRDGHRRPDPGR